MPESSIDLDVSPAEAWQRLSPAARRHVLVADLRAQGISDCGTVEPNDDVRLATGSLVCEAGMQAIPFDRIGLAAAIGPRAPERETPTQTKTLALLSMKYVEEEQDARTRASIQQRGVRPPRR